MELRRESVPAPGGSFDLITLFGVQPFQNNVYVLIDPESRESVVIDASEAAPIIDATAGLRVQSVLVTHGHWDHHDGLRTLREHLGESVPIGIGQADTRMLDPAPTLVLGDGQELRFGRHVVRTISTPGHTPGSTCFSIGGLLFSGDTLFPGGPGNTNPDSNRWGDFPTILRSIRERLCTLPDATRVLPGHGGETSIGTERPHLEEWAARGW